MPLNYHLNREVSLSEESEFKNLYLWSIQEFDGEGKKGRDYVPWNWTLNFTATKIVYRQQYGLGERYWRARRDKGQSKEAEEPSGFVEREQIRVVLRPGYANEDPRWATTYSMFGTDRTITDIALWILPVEDEDEKEKCVVHGGLSYTTEIDFRNETLPDHLHFYASVSRKRFADIKARVKSGDFDFVAVTVNGVEGFYSEWSPSISTSNIKVLTKLADHKLELPEGTKINPPMLNGLDQFELHLISERKIRLPIIKADDDEPGDLGYDVVEPVEQERARADHLLRVVSRLENKSKKAQVALWIIAALLLLALFK